MSAHMESEGTSSSERAASSVERGAWRMRRERGHSSRFHAPRSTLHVLLPLLLLATPAPAAQPANEPAKPDCWFYYTNDVNEDIPLSIHIVRVERAHRDFEFCTTLGKSNTTFGMGIVSEQVKSLPPGCGEPLAAINGDFDEKSKVYMGRPRDVQVHFGEVVSTPAGYSCFWTDPDGSPHMTNVFSRFRVIWADDKTTPIGLNQFREDDAAVLYTSIVGHSTRTVGGPILFSKTQARDRGCRCGSARSIRPESAPSAPRGTPL